MRPLFFGLFLFPILPFLAKAEVTATVDETRPLAATGEIVVENVNGPIVIETWDKPEIHLVAVKTARTEADLKALDVVVDSAEKRFAVKTVYLDKDGSWLKKFTNTGEVRYTLTVPHTATLRRIETVNGSISIANAHGRITAKTVNGRIEARGLSHEVELSTVNDGILAEFDAVSVKQDIVLDTVNGSLRLRLPANAGAEVSASTLNGSIENDFGLAADSNKWVGRKLEGTIGDGAARIRLKAINGGIEIRKR
jgi:phosphohistidine phosphatase SixA